MSIKITQKRAPKNPIKFQLTLNPEQKLAKRLILENAITVIKGKQEVVKHWLLARQY